MTAPNARTPAGPAVTSHEVMDRDDISIFLRARQLGFSSSQTTEHQSHPGDFARPGTRCSACRWFECRIFEVSFEVDPEDCTCGNDRSFAEDLHTDDCRALKPAPKRFLVVTYGLSDVPNEVDKRRASWTDSAFEIIELLTQRGREDRQAFLPAASARALAQAATFSPEIKEAYIDRAVV